MKGRIKGGIWETINFSTGGHQPITSSLIAAEAASPNTGGEAIKLISRVVHGPSWYMDGGYMVVYGMYMGTVGAWTILTGSDPQVDEVDCSCLS